MNADRTAPIDNDLARRYLLGKLSEEEADRLEEQLLEDGEVSDQIAAASDDLVDDYASGQLSREDRVSFERQLRASSRLRERAAFARSLDRLVREADEQQAPDTTADAETQTEAEVVAWPRRRSSTRWAQWAAAASVVLGIGCGWLLWRSESLRQQVIDLEAAHEVAAHQIVSAEEQRRSLSERADELDRQLAAERAAGDAARQENAEIAAALEQRGQAAPRPPVTSSFLLSAALRSELGERRLELPEAAERVRLTLDLGVEEDFSSYLAVVNGPTGGELWSGSGLTASAGGTAVDLVVPATLLADGRHEVLLYGETAGTEAPTELVGAFEFDLLRR